MSNLRTITFNLAANLANKTRKATANNVERSFDSTGQHIKVAARRMGGRLKQETVEQGVNKLTFELPDNALIKGLDEISLTREDSFDTWRKSASHYLDEVDTFKAELKKTRNDLQNKLSEKELALKLANAKTKGLENQVLEPANARIYNLKEAVDFKWYRPIRSTWRALKCGYHHLLKVINGNTNLNAINEKFNDAMPKQYKDQLVDFAKEYKANKNTLSAEDNIAFTEFKYSIKDFLGAAFKGDKLDAQVDNWLDAVVKAHDNGQKLKKHTDTGKGKITKAWHQFTDWGRGLFNMEKKHTAKASPKTTAS